MACTLTLLQHLFLKNRISFIADVCGGGWESRNYILLTALDIYLLTHTHTHTNLF